MNESKRVVSPGGAASTVGTEREKQRQGGKQEQPLHEHQEDHSVRGLSQGSQIADVKREFHLLSGRQSLGSLLVRSPAAPSSPQQLCLSDNDVSLNLSELLLKTEDSCRCTVENDAFCAYYSLIDMFNKSFPGGSNRVSQISSGRVSSNSSKHRHGRPSTAKTTESSISVGYANCENLPMKGNLDMLEEKVKFSDVADGVANAFSAVDGEEQGGMKSNPGAAVKGGTSCSGIYIPRQEEREHCHSREAGRGLWGSLESYGTMVLPQDETVGLLNGISRNEKLQWPPLITDLISGIREGPVMCSLYQDELPVFRDCFISNASYLPLAAVEVGAEEAVKTGSLLLLVWLTFVMRQLLFSAFAGCIIALLPLQGTLIAAMDNIADMDARFAGSNIIKPFLFLVHAATFLIVLILIVVLGLLFCRNDSCNVHFLPHIMLLSGLSLAAGSALCMMFSVFQVSLLLLLLGHLMHGMALAVSFLAVLLFAIVEQALVSGTLLSFALGYCTWLLSNAMGLFLFSSILQTANGKTTALGLLVAAMLINLLFGIGMCLLVPPETCRKAARAPRYFFSVGSSAVEAVRNMSIPFLLRAIACGCLFAMGILFTVVAGESSLQLSPLQQYTVSSPLVGPYVTSLLFLSGLFFFPFLLLPYAGCRVRIAESGLCSALMLVVLLYAAFCAQLGESAIAVLHISPLMIAGLVMFLSGLSLSVSVAGVLRSLCMPTRALPAAVSAWLFAGILALCTLLALALSTLLLWLLPPSREEGKGIGKDVGGVTCVLLGLSALAVLLQVVSAIWRRCAA